MYGSPIPTCGFDFFPPSARTVRQSLHAVSIASPLSARTARQFLPALSDFPLFPHVQLADPYLHFRFPTAFRTYGSPIPTCGFGFLPFSARPARQFLPALSDFPLFPHVRLADPYLRFRFPPIFRTYCPSIPTCAFDRFSLSACTARRFLPALSASYRFPHVHPADSYMRLRPRRVFRTYTPSIPTCAFGFLPFSACTARSPHVGFALPVRDTEAKAPIGCNCLNCLNV